MIASYFFNGYDISQGGKEHGNVVGQTGGLRND